MSAGSLRLEAALLLRPLTLNGDSLLIALLRPGHGGAGGGATELHRDLVTLRLRRVLGHRLLADVTLLHWPVGALLGGRVAAGHVLALALYLSPAGGHVVLHLVRVLEGGALAGVL